MSMKHYSPPPSSIPPPNFTLRLANRPGGLSYHSPLTPIHFLLRAALISPKKYAVVHPERGYGFTYEQWAARTLSLTFALLGTPGWGKGERCAIISPNTPMILEAHTAVLAAGGIITPINIRNNTSEVAYVLQHSDARIVLVDHEFVHLVPNPIPPGITVIISQDSGGRNPGDQYEAFLNEGRRKWDTVEQAQQLTNGVTTSSRHGWELIDQIDDENADCALCYTSGTTGRPKGVRTSHRGGYLAAVANAYESKIDRDSVYLWVLPAFHACGWTFPWAVNAAQGTHHVLRKVVNDDIWDALLNYGVTHYCGAPTVQIGIVNHPSAKKLDRIVRVTVAAAAPTADLLRRMETLNLHPVHVYGLTETYGPCVRRYDDPSWRILPTEERATLMSRQGHSFLTADEVRVVRCIDENHRQSSPQLIDVKKDGNEIGEIILRGNLVMKGYYRDEEATAKAMVDGWFFTGDLAVRYPGGEICIQDRSKDIIISGGENVSSLAVENQIASHPAVLECSVVVRPHPRWQERGHAYVVLKPDVRTRPDEKELVNHCRETLSGFAVPEWWDFVESLPKTSTGKIQKNILRQRSKEIAAREAEQSQEAKAKL